MPKYWEVIVIRGGLFLFVGKHLIKRSKYKSRPESVNKERQLLRRDSSLADDNDEVSSTTTESSGGDSEEKVR